jgi:fructose-specific PTS system IIA-like component
MSIGAMIEVPSAAFLMDALCAEFDFFSVGSNDLLQYFMAADRGNPAVKALYNPLQPAFLQLLNQIVTAVRQNKKWIGLCGEAGAEIFPLLAGLGLDEISVSAPAIAGLKAEMAELTFSDCQRLLSTAMRCATAHDVSALVEQFIAQHNAPLLEPDLVILDSNAQTKEEVIKQAADRLFVMGRTKNPRVVEDAIWEREQAYSTGFGHGFAIPHCKSDAVHFDSLALVKLRTPIPWNSLDGKPVHVAVLFAARDSGGANNHMKVFAKLARLMMDENFRARIESENDADALCQFIRSALPT